MKVTPKAITVESDNNNEIEHLNIMTFAPLGEERVVPKPAEVLTLPDHMDHHDHSHTQIVIGLRGRSEFDVSGVGNIVGPGQGCVVNAEVSHAFGGIVDRPDILVLNLPTHAQQEKLVFDQIRELSSSDVYFQLDTQIQKLIQMLVVEMKASPEDVLLGKACSDTVMTLLLRHTSTFQQVSRDHRLNLDAIDLYIETHMGRKITISQLAASVFLGESQFHALFKDLVGVTPHQYVLNKRIETAKALIQQGGVSLTNIAELTGFSNQSTFTHAFSRLQGCSPSHFKKSIS